MPKPSDPSPETNGVPLEVPPKLPALPPGRRRWVAWLVVVGILVAGWAAYLYAKRPAQTAGSAVRAVPTAVIRTGSVERLLRITGQTSARNYASITVTRFRGQPRDGRG